MFHPAGVNERYLLGRAVIFHADQRPTDRRYVYVAVKHRMVRRDGHSKNCVAWGTQRADDETVFDGREEHVPVRSRNQSKSHRSASFIVKLK